MIHVFILSERFIICNRFIYFFCNYFIGTFPNGFIYSSAAQKPGDLTRLWIYTVISDILCSYPTHLTDMTDKKTPPSKIKLNRSQVLEGLEQIPMETIIKGEGKKRNLTTKQKGFIRDVALGKPKAQAYRDNYDTKANPKVVGNNAHNLSVKSGIASEIEAFKVAIEAQSYQSSAHLKAFIMHQLTLHALNEDNPPASRIRSLELLGKTYDVGLFEDRKVVTTINQSSEVKTKLIAQIKSLLGNQSHITDVDIDDGDSLLSEISGFKEEKSGDDAADPTPQMLVRGGTLDMHSIPHIQSPENNQATHERKETHTLKTEDFENLSLQVFDSIKEKNASANVCSYQDENDSHQGGGGIEKMLEDAERDIGTPPVNALKSKG